MKRKIQEFAKNGKVAKVYRDSDWEEYCVTFYANGSKLANADYHTSDKADAIDTAKHWVNPEH